MENLKIRVNSEAESKEVQGLLEKLGFKKSVWGTYSDYFIFANSNYYSRDDIPNFSECDYKEITLPDLRDLVVLKRNNREDANAIDTEYDASLYLDSKGDLFVFHLPAQKWKESNLNGEEDVMARLKPIEKQMKEYLRKNSNDTYSYIGTVRPEHVSDFMIEIPEGATKLVSHGCAHLPIMFVKPCANGYSYCYSSGIWSDTILSNIKGRDVFWSRHTLPEDLPFIDDEPKIETATGYQLDVVGSNTYGSRSRYDGESDISYRQYLMDFIVGNRTESLNDQYAEIETVRQTLNQRQEQYGSFEDVAMITEQMVDVMRKGYYKNLAYNQKMALYMICSKMARIVNGNPNHKDSWHDIAGYATLIDNELVSEKDMPF